MKFPKACTTSQISPSPKIGGDFSEDGISPFDWKKGLLRQKFGKLWGCNLTYSCLLSQASPNKPHKHLNYILCQHHTRVAGTESLPFMVQNFPGVHLDVSAQSGVQNHKKFMFS